MRGIFFFFNDTATTEIYTLSLHDALPIYRLSEVPARRPTGDGPSAIVTVWSQLQPPRADHRGSGGFSVASRCGSPQGSSLPSPSVRPSGWPDRKSTRLNSSHANISYAVFCLKKTIRLV